MKLFTSDSAVYKRDVGWVGGTSQASGGLGNVSSAPACSKAGTAGVSRPLLVHGEEEQRRLHPGGVRSTRPCPLAALFEVRRC